MNYFILPKMKTYFIFNKINYSNDILKPCLSDSLIFFSNVIYNQIETLNYEINEELKKKKLEEDKNIDGSVFEDYDIYKIMNPYEYLNTNQQTDNEIIILHEILNAFKLFDIFSQNNKKINIGFYGVNDKQIKNYFYSVKNKNIIINSINSINGINNIEHYKNNNNNENNDKGKNDIDFLFYKIENYNNKERYNDYILRLIKSLYIMLKIKNNNILIIFNIDNITFKPNIDIIFILTNIFDKVFLIKPLSSNIFTDERYIVCKKNTENLDNTDNIYDINNTDNIDNITHFLKKIMDNWDIHNRHIIYSIVDCEIPLYFLNKIEEINIIIGQQKLDLIYQIINTLKTNKNKIEKIDFIKKNNNLKCVKWFEKTNFPIQMYT